MEITRKGIVVVAAILCTSLIVAGSLIAVQLAKHRRAQCELVNVAPASDLGALRNIPSKKMDAIANFAGYLVYEADYNPLGRFATNNILPLTMEAFVYDNVEQHLLFKTDCCQFVMSGRESLRIEALDIFLIDVRIKPTYADGFTQLCFIEPSDISVPHGKHYSCHATIRYPCYQLRKDKDGRDYRATVAWLVVDNLEVELGGNEESHRNGEFSQPEKSCLGPGPTSKQPRQTF